MLKLPVPSGFLYHLAMADKETTQGLITAPTGPFEEEDMVSYSTKIGFWKSWVI